MFDCDNNIIPFSSSVYSRPFGLQDTGQIFLMITELVL